MAPPKCRHALISRPFPCCLLPAPATIALVRFRAISRAFFCARLIFSYPVISYTRLRSPCSLRRYCPPRLFLAPHVKSPARQKRRSERQIHGRHAQYPAHFRRQVSRSAATPRPRRISTQISPTDTIPDFSQNRSPQNAKFIKSLFFAFPHYPHHAMSTTHRRRIDDASTTFCRRFRNLFPHLPPETEIA